MLTLVALKTPSHSKDDFCASALLRAGCDLGVSSVFAIGLLLLTPCCPNQWALTVWLLCWSSLSLAAQLACPSAAVSAALSSSAGTLLWLS